MNRIQSGTARRTNPVSLAFEQQAEAILCHEPFVALCCSGRSGKTRGALLKWLEVCDRKPGELSAFVALTLKQARRIAWRQLKRLDRDLGLGLAFNVQELTVTHPNGSVLHLFGANRDDLIDVLRGSPFAFVYFDEAAFFRDGLLQTAIEDALLIRMMDLDGELWIGSTPGYVEAGYHYDAITGKKPGVRVFHWTYFDNPHLPEYPREPDAEKRRALRLKAAVAVRERMGWTETTPSYVRDWLGKYARDTDALVYKFERGRNCVQAMPASWTTDRESWVTVLGIDYGSTNATAWTLLAFQRGSPLVYVVASRKRYGLAPTVVSDITKQEWLDVYHPDATAGDPAAKSYLDQMQERYQIQIDHADKVDKRAHIRTLNDALAFHPEPRLLIVEPDCLSLCDELEKLGKDPRFGVHHPKHGAEDPNAENDGADSFLYGYTRVYAWLEGLMVKLEADELAAKQEGAEIDPSDLASMTRDDPYEYVL